VWIYGPSGCGKSTLLRALLGLWDWEGDVLYEGESLHQTDVLKKFRSVVGWVPQDPPEFPGTLNELLVQLNSFLPTKVSLNNWMSYIQKLGVDPLPKDLKSVSGGERRRIFLALALARKCRILFLDETLGSLDLKMRSVVDEVVKDSSVELVFTVAHDADANFNANKELRLEVSV